MIKMKQILAPQFEGKCLSYVLLALGEDGVVYRYDSNCNGWLPYPMNLVNNCKIGKDHRR